MLILNTFFKNTMRWKYDAIEKSIKIHFYFLIYTSWHVHYPYLMIICVPNHHWYVEAHWIRPYKIKQYPSLNFFLPCKIMGKILIHQELKTRYQKLNSTLQTWTNSTKLNNTHNNILYQMSICNQTSLTNDNGLFILTYITINQL